MDYETVELNKIIRICEGPHRNELQPGKDSIDDVDDDLEDCEAEQDDGCCFKLCFFSH